MKVFSVLLVFVLLTVTYQTNLYKVLEIEQSSTQKDIKKAFRKLTKIYHPDKNKGSKEASAKFQQINEAYEILSNNKKRRIYDRKGYEAAKSADNQQQEDFGGMFS